MFRDRFEDAGGDSLESLGAQARMVAPMRCSQFRPNHPSTHHALFPLHALAQQGAVLLPQGKGARH
jgi:hypothetical protein